MPGKKLSKKPSKKTSKKTVKPKKIHYCLQDGKLCKCESVDDCCDVIRVRLSGGANRARFEGFQSKEEVEDFLTSRFSQLEISKSGKFDFIVTPNSVEEASNSAKRGETEVTKTYCLDEFVEMMSNPRDLCCE